MNDPPAYKDLLHANRKGEKWKDIDGYDGHFQISSHGRIKSMPRPVDIEIPARKVIIPNNEAANKR